MPIVVMGVFALERPLTLLGRSLATLFLACGPLACESYGSPEQVSIERLLDGPAKWSEHEISVEGLLVSGSIVELGSPCRLRFRIREWHDSVRTLAVHFERCEVPDSFPWPAHKWSARHCAGDLWIRVRGRLVVGPGAPHVVSERMSVRDGRNCDVGRFIKPRR